MLNGFDSPTHEMTAGVTLADLGFERPYSHDEWLRVGRVAQLSAEQLAEMSHADIFVAAMEWADALLQTVIAERSGRAE